jgi:catechol 2,3-dioxygenase-like lactoylglutathione lyase family enzyme
VFDHVTIRVADLSASKGFYDSAFATIDFAGTPFVGEELCEWEDFSIAPADASHPAAQRLHLGFRAPSRARVGIALRKREPDRMQFRGEHGSFSFVSGDEPTEHIHLAFGVPDDSRVDEFHRVALAAGYRDNGPPGERPEYHAGYYGAYVLDPDGHNVEAVSHNRN